MLAAKKEDHVPNDDGGDEEQGGNRGEGGSQNRQGRKDGGNKQQGQKRQQVSTPNRGLLRGPGTPDQSPQQNGQYDTANDLQYEEQPYVQPSYEDYEGGYVSHYAEPLVRSPSIDMNWQTLRGPSRGVRR